MNYGNQPDHDNLTARPSVELLLAFSHGQSSLRSASRNAADRTPRQLQRLCGSDLERDWLRSGPHGTGCPLVPSTSSKHAAPAQTSSTMSTMRPSMWTVRRTITPRRRTRDATQNENMEDGGYVVIRFGHKDDWTAIITPLPAHLREGYMKFAVGSLVKARGREWVVLPESDERLLVLRPLGGTDAEVTGDLRPLGARGARPV